MKWARGDALESCEMLPKKRRQPAKRKGPHPEKALSDSFCRNVQEAGRYADGNGLYLLVEPSGARRWIQRLVVNGRPRKLGLGSYKLVPLAKARELGVCAAENRCDNCRRAADERGLDVDSVSPLCPGAVAAVAA